MAAENKILDYIQLINSANIGPVTFYKPVSYTHLTLPTKLEV